MIKEHFYFGSIVGVSLAVLGSVLALSGVFDWSLFWVGCAIGGLTCATAIGSSPQRQLVLMPVIEQAPPINGTRI